MTPGAGTRFPFAAGVCLLNTTMPGCRAPTPSKGEQRFGALFSVEQSIELTTAVGNHTWARLDAPSIFFASSPS